MLVKGLNDSIESIYKTAEIIKEINPVKAYLLIPTRPPAESEVKPPDEHNLNHTLRVFNNFMINTEILSCNEGTDFAVCGTDAEKELLSILAVHPMLKDAVEEYIAKTNSDYSLIKALIDKNKIKEVIYNHNSYLIIVN
jgi:wyosine [tRNA(Phe)-imidazoG37] synthetase (radical SAM superfamily)